MNYYRYRVHDQQGQQETGTVQAVDLDSARKLLATNHPEWTIEELLPLDAPVVARSTTRPLSRQANEELAEQLADLTSADWPLETGLRKMSEELGEFRLWGRSRQQRQLLHLAEQLEKGVPLEQALKAQGASADLITVLHSGIKSGHPGTLLAEYVNHRKMTTALKSQALLGFAYPGVLLLFAFLLFLFMMTIVVPMFSELYHSEDLNLISFHNSYGQDNLFVYNVFKSFTASVFFISDLITDYWFSLVFALLFFVGAVALSRVLLPARISRQIQNHIPLIGPVFAAVSMSRFAHSLAFLIESGASLAESLRSAGSSTGDALIAHASFRWAEAIEKGHSPREAARQIGGIPAELLDSFHRKHDSRFLSRALHGLGEMYAARSRVRTTLLISLSEPVIVTLIGIIFLWVVIGLFWPLFLMLNLLSPYL